MSVPTMPVHSSLSIRPSYLRAKRLLDILFSLLILLPLCLVIAVIAVLIRLDSEARGVKWKDIHAV